MQRYGINTPHIVSEVFGDEEAAVINLKTGNYYSLNKMATRIWSLIEHGASLNDINNSISDSFKIEDSFQMVEIGQFIEKLIGEGLITAESESSSLTNTNPVNTQKTTIKSKKEYESPVLECYADVQELLLLDPIHEVEETNWLVNKTS